MVKAVNMIGASPASEELRIALGRLPDQPTAPRKVEADSTMTTMMLEWDEVVELDGVEGEGYSLYMDDGYHGEYSVVYNGTGFPETRQFLVTNLTTGLPYRFEVTAHNLNGESIRGPTATIYACLIPSNLPEPMRVSTTSTSVLIEWTEPDDNGCPILGFVIFRNTGANDAVTVTVDGGAAATLPSLR